MFFFDSLSCRLEVFNWTLPHWLAGLLRHWSLKNPLILPATELQMFTITPGFCIEPVDHNSCFHKKHFTYWANSSAPNIFIAVVRSSQVLKTHWLRRDLNCFVQIWIIVKMYSVNKQLFQFSFADRNLVIVEEMLTEWESPWVLCL